MFCLCSLPPSPEGLFRCDACGKQGNGFSYHCGICNIDLHATRAAMPLIVAHQCHHHQLNLTFFIPYLNKCFSCDICHNLGSKQWLYRCNLCEFDAHLDCATAEPKPAPVQAPIQQVRAPILQGQVQYYQRAPTQAITQYQVVGTPMVTRPPMQSFAPNNMLMAVGRSNQQGYPLLNQVLQGLLGVGGGGIDLGSTLGGGGVDFGGLGGPDLGGSGSS